MNHEADFTVSVLGGWTGTTLSSYTIRAARAREALRIAQAKFWQEHGTHYIDAAWILRAHEVRSNDEDLA